ncbi:murein hydrolase activator EnvC family protein [Sphingorhabdus contaminans]|uniref:murein hydrolase activator EnvC family protein n=1 Tax=Sphingorhabdus contaminans TaxID=1343899 RepID=UPI003D2A6FE2
MRFALTLSLLALAPVGFAAALMAQNGSARDGQEQALRDAKLKAVQAERRSEMLRQEASNAASAADRIVAQRAVLSAEIAAAEAQIEAANARIAIISRRQRAQQKALGQQSEPILRLNAALQQMTGRPTALMMAQPGHREDYIHVRAVMATVQPQIVARTNALRQQIASQNELRAQELLALQTLSDARSRLTNRRAALARLEGSARGKADDFAANAAIEFERAIAQGERARDIVGRIDTERLGSVTAAELAALSGPALRLADDRQVEAQAGVYILPVQGKLVSGFNELNATGYRERGVRLSVAPGTRVVAPAAGKISFAGRYRSYGQIVILEHGKGWNSLITHLGNVRVARGDLVRQGSPLGEAGRETSEIGVELRKNGRVMDIAALLR